jgi:PAS domain S-box-containing protein
MSVEPVSPPRAASTLASRATPALATLAGSALLAAGVLGALPTLPAACAAIGLSAAVHGTLLVRVALAMHRRDRVLGPCRGAGLASLAVFTGGATATTAALVRHSTAIVARLATGGLVVAALLYVAGMLLNPSAAVTPVARTRQALDALGVGACFLFTCWVLVIAPHGSGGGALAAVDAAAASIAVTSCAVALLRADRYRTAAALCCAGTALSVLGLLALALALAGAVSPVWLPLVGCCLVYGPLLSLLAAQRYAAAPPGGRTATDGSFATYPVMAAPIGVVLLAAVYHMITVRSFDAVSASLGCGVVAVITARETFAVFDIRRYARVLAAQDAQFRSLVAGSSDVTMVLDGDLVVRWQSSASARQFGLCDRDVLGGPFAALVHPEDAPAVREQLDSVLAGAAPRPGTMLVQARVRDGDGHWRDTESTVNDLRRVPEVGGIAVHVRDVGARLVQQRGARRPPPRPSPAGMTDRAGLLRGVTALRAEPERSGALLVVALDGVAELRAERGDRVAEAVLLEIDRRLRGACGELDLAGRLTDDAFAVATSGAPVHAYALATRLLTVLGQPYPPAVAGRVEPLTVEIGMAELAPADGAEQALHRAELAVSRARQLGRGRIEWYDEVLEAAVTQRAALERHLPGTLLRGELDLVYRPVIDLAGRRHPVGVQAQIRWHHAGLGGVAASEFIPVADDLGLYPEIGAWLVDRACCQLARWLGDGHELWLAVELAGRRVPAPALAGMVRRALEAHRVPAEHLVVEITEARLHADDELALAQLAGVRALGARTGLTQFGTGTTPLGQLRRLPIDLLTVDQVIYAGPAGRAGAATPIMDVVVSLGQRLGLQIVADGLAAEAHLDAVRAAGCRYGQGALFGRPVPAEHFEAYLEGARAAT